MARDRTKHLEAKRRHYERHRESILEKQKLYRQANAEVIAARDSERKKRDRAANPDKFKERGRAWSAANPEKVKARSQQWLAENGERKRQTNAAWKARNAEKVRQQAKDWWQANKERGRQYAAQRRADPRKRLEEALRSGIYNRMSREAGRKGRSKTFDLLGYGPAELAAHLERQFSKGMTWDNYGEWHIDHIVPVSTFSYDSFESDEFRAAWALTNLRPMWSADNISKGAKRLTLL